MKFRGCIKQKIEKVRLNLDKFRCIYTEFRQNLYRIQTKIGQNLDKIQTKFRQNLDVFRRNLEEFRG